MAGLPVPLPSLSSGGYSTAVPQGSPRAPGMGLNQTSNVLSIGALRGAPLQSVMEEERRDAEVRQAQPIIGQLAHHVRKEWSYARNAKRMTVEDRMLQNVRARRGAYDPDKIAAIRELGGTDVYAMLTSVKCRAAASWLRDVMLTNGTEKPWTIRPTPVPDLPPDIENQIIAQVVKPMTDAVMAGQPMEDPEVLNMMGTLRDHAMNQIREQARVMAVRMEAKIEDQLAEGGFIHALNQFIDDIVTFPSAVLKGPVVRAKNRLKWVQGADGQWTTDVQRETKLEWERVSPFNIYPSPAAESIDDGYLIEKHQLSRQDLNELIGVPGYDDNSIRLVLDLYGRGGLRDWLYDDISRASAEGKSTVDMMANTDQLIDALQYWGSVQGKLLLEWGMDAKQIEDPLKDYDCEIWVIGPYVIKATLNHHPLGQKPYYKTSYEEIPGSFWGNAPADLIRDAQVVVNAATRALVNNMGLASGPQVGVNVDRLAPGEDLTQLRPWRIWQMTSDPMGNGNTQPPLQFFQPKSNVAELMGIIQQFMNFADEWSGIPKYLTGDAPGGAGRTASGLSMLMSNAGKSLKQVVANVDNYVMRPLLERLYYWNMRFADDPDLKGDVNIIVRGANALVAQEAAQVRRSEFLAQTINPVDMQIIGVDGRAQVLREVAKGLDMDTDKIVPPEDVLRQRAAAVQSAMAAQAGTLPAPQTPAAVALGPTPAGQMLQNGAPVTDNFSPPKSS